MKYSKRSVFFQRLRVDAHLRYVGRASLGRYR